ncbi:hypothetical protein HYU21_04070 [Candidatus Woesearchaeota archaeon]|nr:hypothetical protein [Candidatus Woesearchaeota archaeon]
MKPQIKSKFNFRINRRGMMDDAFDLLFTVMIMVFAFLLIFGLLQGEDSDKKKVAEEYAVNANYAYDAISNLRNTGFKEGIFTNREPPSTDTLHNLIDSLSSKLPREITKNKLPVNSQNTETNPENKK